MSETSAVSNLCSGNDSNEEGDFRVRSFRRRAVAKARIAPVQERSVSEDVAGVLANVRTQQAAVARRPRDRRDGWQVAGARGDAVPVARLQAAVLVACRAIHHGFVKFTVRDNGIALEAICAGASPNEDTLRCTDGAIMDEALIAPGPNAPVSTARR